MNIQCVTKGVPNNKEQLAIKKAIWSEKDKEIIRQIRKHKNNRDIEI